MKIISGQIGVASSMKATLVQQAAHEATRLRSRRETAEHSQEGSHRDVNLRDQSSAWTQIPSRMTYRISLMRRAAFDVRDPKGRPATRRSGLE
jgi:hypothetical protein